MILNGLQSRRLVDKMLMTTTGAAEVKAILNYLRSETSMFPTRYGSLTTDGLVSEWLNKDNRTRLRYFHGFLFMQGWASAIQDHGSVAEINKIVSIIETWLSKFPLDEISGSDMSYHDETTAQRLNNLLSFTMIRGISIPPETLDRIRMICDDTAQLLLDEQFHSGLNNHGMFQDLALRNYAVVATWAPDEIRTSMIETSSGRLRSYFLHAFTSEGVHVENTPTYHLMVAKSLKSHVDLMSSMEIHDNELESLYASASKYATHIVMPNGDFPPISDTTKISLVNSAGSVFDEYYAYAASRGLKGEIPSQTSVAFSKSGYAIYRSDWRDEHATYCLFQSAYNNDYHKHSDDLSLILYAHGKEIITEPGPYSYDYKDKFSRYAYSQFAHNNIVVDGKSTNRTDQNSDSVKMLSVDTSDDEFIAVGETGRLSGVTHRRKVDIRGEKRKESITITDSLISEEQHKYTQHWNIAENLHVVPHGNGFEVYDGENKLLDAIIETDVAITLNVIKGRTEPTVLGWTFPAFGKKASTNVVQVQFSSRKSISVKTKFEISDFNYAKRGVLVTPELDWKRYSSGRGLTYLETSSLKNPRSEPLVFVFSAMGVVGDFTFNYKSTLDDVDCTAIYILDDFGDQGAYYLAEKRSNYIFDTVHKFIAAKIEEHGGDHRPIYFVGSSKGGTAAMLHGLLFPEAKIFVGAPQTRIGSFVKTPHPNILKFMAGDTNQDAIDYLDDVLYEEKYLKNAASSVTIVVGKADHHYKNHVLPWVNKVRDHTSNTTMIVLEGTPHSEIGKAYRSRLKKELSKDLSSHTPVAVPLPSNPSLSAVPLVGKHKVWYDHISQLLFASCEPKSGTETAYRLYKDNKLVASKTYQDVNFTAWSGLSAGRYRVRFFRRTAQAAESDKVTSSWVVVP